MLNISSCNKIQSDQTTIHLQRTIFSHFGRTCFCQWRFRSSNCVMSPTKRKFNGHDEINMTIIISTWIAKKKLLRSHPLNFHLGAYPLLNLFPEIIQNCNSSILFTPYTITSVCTFFTLFLNTLPKVLHSCNPNVWFRDDIVWGNWMLHVCIIVRD